VISGTASAYTIDAGSTDPVSGNNAMTVTTKAMVVADPLEPNDTPATATLLPLGTTSDLIFSSGDVMDTDWYKFYVPPADAGKDLKVNVHVTSPYPSPIPPGWRSDVDFDVLDAALNERAIAVSASDNETLYIPAAASGWYYINMLYSEVVYADSNGWARYAITIETGTNFGIGYLSGRVLDSDGNGVEHVHVQANTYPYDWSISFVTGTTGPGGYFTVAASPGQHYLFFTGDGTVSPNNPEVNIVDEYYLNTDLRDDATPVTASAGQTLNVGDINVATGAIVSGQVTNQSAAPISGALVGGYDMAGNRRSTVYTDSTGHYTLKRVPVGGAKVRFSSGSVAAEFYDNQPAFTPGTTLATAPGVEITGINGQLTPGSFISGTVKNAQGTGQIVTLYLYSVLDGTFARTSAVSTAGTGAYSFARAMPGSYKIFVVPAGENYPPEWYNNAPSFAQAFVVTVTEGVPTPNINFVLGAVNGADFNRDQKSDILWRHASTGEVWLWPMDGAGRAAESFVRRVADTDWEIRAVADFNGDRIADLMWRNKTTGQIYLWPMNGSTPLAESYVGTVDTAYDIVAAGDFTEDGKADLLWRNSSNGDVWVWIMNGATIQEALYVATVDPAYKVKGIADFDGDGAGDVVWHNDTNGEVWIWLVNETYTEHWVATVPDTNYTIAGVADFTGDGRADLLWHNAVNGEVWIWTMNGAERVSETWVATVPDTNYGIVSTGDYNGDTKADILWWNSVNGEVWLWLMNGTAKLSETWVATVPDTGYRIIR
jgi:hypothetical protein